MKYGNNAVSPPVAAEIFSKINGATSSRGRSAYYITTWQMLFLFTQPFITALSALFECSSHSDGEQFTIGVAVIVLIVFLLPCAIAGVKHLYCSVPGVVVVLTPWAVSFVAIVLWF